MKILFCDLVIYFLEILSTVAQHTSLRCCLRFSIQLPTQKTILFILCIFFRDSIATLNSAGYESNCFRIHLSRYHDASILIRLNQTSYFHLSIFFSQIFKMLWIMRNISLIRWHLATTKYDAGAALCVRSIQIKIQRQSIWSQLCAIHDPSKSVGS